MNLIDILRSPSRSEFPFRILDILVYTLTPHTTHCLIRSRIVTSGTSSYEIPYTSMALVAVEAESCADKVKYVCVVKDETQIDYNKQKVVFSLAYDCDVRELCCETARRMKYQEETYLLVWEKADNVTVVEVVLDWNSSQSLMDLGLNEKRNTFLVREKDGKQPVTVGKSKRECEIDAGVFVI